jgi:hypothetical protein
VLQDAETGLPQHRKEKLLQVFKIIDKVRAGPACQRFMDSTAAASSHRHHWPIRLTRSGDAQLPAVVQLSV